MRYLRPVFLALLVMIIITTGTVYAQDDEPYTIGILQTNEVALQAAFDGFVEAMVEMGYVEGENVTYIYFDAMPEEVDDESVEALDAQLTDADPDLVLVSADWDAELVEELTDDVPIVVCFSEDLVGVGLAESLTEPGGDVTGIHNAGYHARGMQILLEIDPTIEKVVIPYTLGRRESLTVISSLQEIAVDLEIELITVGVTTDDVVDMILTIPDDIDAIYLPPDRFALRPEVYVVLMMAATQRNAALVIPAAIPAPGALMGYGPDTFANGRQAAGIADRIFRGADPATLPLENSEFFLMVNLQTAASLELEIPRSILRQAKMIIRPGDLDDFELPGDQADD